MRPPAYRLFRSLLITAVVLVALLQTALPWFSGIVAADLPDEAFMRWPVVAITEVGLLCVQAALVCGTRLLTLAQRDELATTPRARRWAHSLGAAFLGMSLTCVAMLLYQGSTVSGPPLLSLSLLVGVPSGVGLAVLAHRTLPPRTAPATIRPEPVEAS